ncbi:23S rRNA (uracil(1939)-C(5))-methyltransferase RlmD [Candidatus Margulisiibacteriota bacterium]
MNKIKKNQTLKLKITEWAEKGLAKGYINGFPILVPNTIPGEEIEALIIKCQATHAYAKLRSIIHPSKDRAVPLCPVSNKCGGCQLQHVTQAGQIDYKIELLTKAFKNHGLDFPKPKTITMKRPFYYRNKAHYSLARDQSGEILMGLTALRSQRVIDAKECCIQHPLSIQAAQFLRDVINSYPVPVFSALSHSDGLATIVTRIGVNTNELMVILSANVANIPEINTIINKLKEISELKSIILNYNSNPAWMLLGAENTVIWGKPFITEKIKGLSLMIGGDTFFQANTYLAAEIWETVYKILKKASVKTVWDLYCGAGGMSLYLATLVQKVIGIESQKESIEIAKQNAIANNIKNINFIEGEVENIIHDIDGPCDAVVVDPPRTGLDMKVVEELLKKQPEIIIYVSCDPSSLARDISALIKGGYKCKEISVIDQFAQTYHVESIVFLGRAASEGVS